MEFGRACGPPGIFNTLMSKSSLLFAILITMIQDKHNRPKREKVALEALKQNMALIKRGLEVHGLHANGASELISRSKSKENVWEDALTALKARKSANDVKPTSDVESTAELLIYSDGGSRGNPGPSASGYVILTKDESHVLERGGQYLGITTNNQAEYQAVKLALEAAAKFEPKSIQFRIDSMLVVNQLNGTFKVKSKELWPVHEEIKRLAENYGSVKYKHVYREYNQLADDEVNKVLDAQK